jgi:hypothetical protein
LSQGDQETNSWPAKTTRPITPLNIRTFVVPLKPGGVQRAARVASQARELSTESTPAGAWARKRGCRSGSCSSPALSAGRSRRVLLQTPSILARNGRGCGRPWVPSQGQRDHQQTADHCRATNRLGLKTGVHGSLPLASPALVMPNGGLLTRRRAGVAETQPDFDLMADSMDRFILSLIWEEADPQRRKTRKDA